MRKHHFAFGLFCFVLLVILAGCASSRFDSSVLRSSGLEVVPRLPNLKYDDADFYVSSSNSISTNSYFYTMLTRELEDNILEIDGDYKGSLDVKIINCSKQMSFTTGYFDLEVEFSIYTLDGKRVWRRDYVQSYDRHYIWDFPSDGDDMNIFTNLFRTVIEEFKQDLQSNREQIVQKLQI